MGQISSIGSKRGNMELIAAVVGGAVIGTLILAGLVVGGYLAGQRHD